MGSRRPKILKCRRCKRKLRPRPRGPLPTYCRSCRQRHYEEGLAGRAQTVLTQEINSLKVQQMIREEVQRFMNRLLIDAPPRSPPAKPKKKRPPLRIVRNDDPGPPTVG